MTKGLKLLLVDDEDIEREALRSFAGRTASFFDIREASNGLEALETAAVYKPDLIIMDIRMPGMNGLEVAASIRAFDKRARIIFLTAFGDLDYARSAFKVAADDFLLKPVSEKVFIQSVQKAVEALRDAGGTGGLALEDLENYKNRLFTLIKKAEQERIPELVKDMFRTHPYLEQDLAQFRSAAIWIIYHLNSELDSELNRSLCNTSQYGDMLKHARSVDEAAEILVQVLSSCAEDVIEAKDDPYFNAMRTAIQYMQKNICNPITLDEVSDEAGFSRCHFSRIFHSRTGSTFSEYLCEMRIEKAKEMLKDIHMPMKQLCQLSGFSNPAYFAGVFRKKVGVTPSEYRKMIVAKSRAKLLLDSSKVHQA